MTNTHCPACSFAIEDPQAATCPSCGAALGGAQAPPASTGGGASLPPPPSDGGSSVPFEDRARPFFSRLLETIGLAFSNPSRLFADLPADDIGLPVAYGVITGTLAAVCTLLWQILIGGLATIAEGAGADQLAISTSILVVMMFFSPALVLVGMFVSAGIYHLMLLLLGNGSRGFGVTLRAVSYGSTPNLLGIVPVCGGLVGGLWSLVLIIMAAYYGHRTEGWRAVLAYFLPMIACLCLCFVLMSMFGFLGVLSAL